MSAIPSDTLIAKAIKLVQLVFLVITSRLYCHLLISCVHSIYYSAPESWYSFTGHLAGTVLGSRPQVTAITSRQVQPGCLQPTPNGIARCLTTPPCTQLTERVHHSTDKQTNITRPDWHACHVTGRVELQPATLAHRARLHTHFEWILYPHHTELSRESLAC